MAVTRTMNGKCTCLDEGHPLAVCYLNSHQMPTCVAREDRKEIVFLEKNIQYLTMRFEEIQAFHHVTYLHDYYVSFLTWIYCSLAHTEFNSKNQ